MDFPSISRLSGRIAAAAIVTAIVSMSAGSGQAAGSAGAGQSAGTTAQERQRPVGPQYAQRRQPQQPAAPRAAETPAPAGAGGAGRYAVLREENKDTGCLVNLQQSGRAQLGPGCKDQGVVVFDPVGWASGRNSIILRARKGHRITFQYQPDGTWLREPADKRPLAIRKY